MIRPCFMVVDREFPGNISTRKLVIETAKFNVITAYSSQEALETLRAFPSIHGVVLDAQTYGMTAESLVLGLKQIKNIPIIVICGPSDPVCPSADYQIESLDPRRLLETLRLLVPQEVEAIEKHEEQLN